jgi:hypothetical protein
MDRFDLVHISLAASLDFMGLSLLSVAVVVETVLKGPRNAVGEGMKTRKAYPSDLHDSEWALLEPLVPAVKRGGRPARWSRREIVNGILYVVRTGSQWWALPHDLPPWQTV